jgi:enediyne polyketide synthase
MNNAQRIAIVGIGLRYPDAGSPDELWENVLSGRRAFRTLPDERMNRADYWSADPNAPDRFYANKAAVLREFEFDRVRYKVAGSTFRATDMTHWLALDVTAQALADAGFPDGEGLPKQTTGVILGNTLTGEFSRANVMRLRWPYVRRTLAAALGEKGWSDEESGTFLRELEKRYKAPFPAIDEDSLAGGLANTIAGRICNHFDLGGGGFTVDGACSSSLLSVVSASKALEAHDIDVAVAGGVDLSIDPFEVIGFAKTGALAKGEMKVYDRGSNGFWPGEGSGMLVLMREEDAVAAGKRIYATVAGWGVSSDGRGGITRPESTGHRLALRRAYDRAGYGVGEVSYFEGHGTGTAVGDEVEIEALSGARRAAAPGARPAALSTIKGNIGHTKAAAGVAGLIKATLAVYHQVIPPATSHHDPHPALLADDAAVYVPRTAALWPADAEIRAGVSAMGFGGINTHIAVERAPGATRRTGLATRTVSLVTGRQDAELLLLDGDDAADLRAAVEDLLGLVPKLSFAELGDLAGTLCTRLSGKPVRAAVVATDPDRALAGLEHLLGELDAGRTSALSVADGVFLGDATSTPKITYLFPGQGSGRGGIGALRRRFPLTEDVFGMVDLPADGDQVATEVAQPRIVSGSLAALRVLESLGIDADVAVGHSLGELSALAWAGAMGGAQLLRLATARGQIMASASKGGGAMASLGAYPEVAERLIRGEDVVIAGYNGPAQTVVAGPAASVDRVCARAVAEDVQATRVNVSHAFHSPLVRPASDAMGERLAGMSFTTLKRPVVSTVTGARLDPDADLRTLLREQVVRPVRFHQAAVDAVEGADLVVEVGPGSVLTGLVRRFAPDVPVLPVDSDGPSLAPLLSIVGAAFALGSEVDVERLFADRVVRALPANGDFGFLASPCEAAPDIDALLTVSDEDTTDDAGQSTTSDGGTPSTLEVLCGLAAERVELPAELVSADTMPLDDLHLSSITVGQIVNDATRQLGLPLLSATANFATVSLGELAAMIDELAASEDGSGGDADVDTGEVPGVAPWVRPFSVDYVPTPNPVTAPVGDATGEWSVHATDGHPLAEPLRVALAGAGVGDGVLLCLPEDGTDHVGLILAAGQAAAAARPGGRFVVVQHAFGAAGLARTLHLEHPDVRTTVVGITGTDHVLADVVADVVADVAGTDGFAEVRYTADGTRTVPVLHATPVADGGRSPLGPDDVLLVTGGGKGITAECALAMAQDSGARLALVGRADPAEDTELSANLARMSAAGVTHRYDRLDVTDAEQVAAVVAAIEADLGTVTAIVHGAGRNTPAALGSLTEQEFRQTLATKVTGLRNVLSTVDQDGIRLLVTFGSIIGRAGLRGEAHYATANDWLTELTEQFLAEHPNTRALALEWSVWSGAGMGERLGVVEALMREGITPISVDSGIAVLRGVLADPDAGPVLVVSGRAAGLPTLSLPRPELPLTRFVDRVVVHYPGVELVTEADLSVDGDPYLADHLLERDLLFPAVIGMEAMTQVAQAVTGATTTPVLEDMRFLRPIVVPETGSTTIRIAALVRDADTVDVVIRSSETAHGADHFRARVSFADTGRPEPTADRTTATDRAATVDRTATADRATMTGALPVVPIDPVSELYGAVLFQGKRFQRLLAYRTSSARRAVAELSTSSPAPWFAPFLPQEMVLADPGTRDAVMHGLQCCVPDATLLPEAVERLHLARPADQDTEFVVLDATERYQDGDRYCYDVDVLDPAGTVVERWTGLMLRAVRKLDGTGPWVPPLLGAHVERALERVLGGHRAVAVEPDADPNGPADRAARWADTERAVGRALGAPVSVRHRPDGRPEIDGASVSVSHAAGLTLAVTGTGGLACDVECVLGRSAEDWTGLLGAAQVPLRDLLVAESNDSADVAATRVWSALECLRKAGVTSQALTVEQVHPDGWTVLSTGDACVATWVTTVNQRPEPIVFAVLSGEER